MTSAITSGVSLQPLHVNLFFGEWENSLLLGRLSLEIRLFSGRAGGFGDHFHPSISHCIFYFFILFQQYLDRGAQFSEAGLNG